MRLQVRDLVLESAHGYLDAGTIGAGAASTSPSG
jgi:hypothetical protein